MYFLVCFTGVFFEPTEYGGEKIPRKSSILVLIFCGELLYGTYMAYFFSGGLHTE